jgi:hypothetical protein
VAKPERNIPVGRPRYRRMYNIKMDVGEIKWGTWTGFV